MRSAVRALTGFLLGIGAVVLLLEALLRVLPGISGLNPTSIAEAAPLRNYDPHRVYRYSYTWAMLNAHRGTTNNFGHIAPYDFRSGSHPLIVVGDSFIESLMNDYDATLQGILGASLGGAAQVYGLGGSGLAASDYVVLARQARKEFAPTAAVVLLSDGDMAESLQQRPGGYFLDASGGALALRFQPRSPSPVMSWVRAHVGELALYDYVRGNLKFAPPDLIAGFGHKNADSAQPTRASITPVIERQIADWFLSELMQGAGVAPQCMVLLLDSDRYAIYESRLASPRKDSDAARRYLIERATALGLHVIDLGPVFRAEYARSRLKFDHWPIDRHWNRYGHSVAASAVMQALFNDASSTQCRPAGGKGASAGAERVTREIGAPAAVR